MKRLFTAVFSLRYVAVLAVVGPFFGAVLMMVLGALDTVTAYRLFFGLEPVEGHVEAGEAAMIQLVASVDHFLFATVLMIFAIGLYSLFFRRTLGGHGEGHKLPLSWKQLKDLGGMDEMLLKVIIMLLAVSFLEFVLFTGMGNLTWPVLVVPLTVVALALGLKWISAEADADEEDKEAQKFEKRESDLETLERLAALHQQGSLTDDEFDRSKKRLIKV